MKGDKDTNQCSQHKAVELKPEDIATVDQELYDDPSSECNTLVSNTSIIALIALQRRPFEQVNFSLHDANEDAWFIRPNVSVFKPFGSLLADSFSSSHLLGQSRHWFSP